MISKQHQQWCEKNGLLIGVFGAAKYLGLSFQKTKFIMLDPSLGFPNPIQIKGRSGLYFSKLDIADFAAKNDVKKINPIKNYIGIRNNNKPSGSGLDVKMALGFLGVNVSQLENYGSARCE